MVARSVVTALASAAAVLIVYLVAVRTPLGQTVDTEAMHAVAAVLDGAWWTVAVLDVVSPALVLVGTAALVAAALLARGPVSAVAAGTTVVVTVGLAEVLKLWLVRPAWLDDAGNSLPSGHVAAVAGLAAAAVLAAPAAARAVLGAAGAVAVAATGLATMALGWHRPSDVIASVLLAVGAAAVAAAAASTAEMTTGSAGVQPAPAAGDA